jgi:hypothetical protein
VHRRAFLADLGMGFTGLALSAMLHRDGFASTAPAWSPPDGRPHFTPRAKSVIWLFMNGGVSHLETFDPKPMLDRYAGKTIAETPYGDVQDPERLRLARVVVINDANGQQRNRLLARQVGFRKCGQSGMRSAIGGRAWAVRGRHRPGRSMYTTDDNHGAQTQFPPAGTCSMASSHAGAWVHYGPARSTTTCRSSCPWAASTGTRDDHISGRARRSAAAHQPRPAADFGRPEGIRARRSSRSGSTGGVFATRRHLSDDPALAREFSRMSWLSGCSAHCRMS